ncbi:MAG: MMPL family transporter, partial [Actinomycetota bacterium]|nr:MMPL family transporter [Actinomycetota bacterium]
MAAEPDVEQVVSYWSSGGVPSLRSRDGGEALVLGRVLGDEDALEGRVEELSADYSGDHGPIVVGVAGSAEVFRQLTETVEADLARAELLSLPVTLILLVLVFGSLVAATLPLAVGTIAVLGALLALRGLVAVTDVSIFALNLTTGLGLGLAIDYSLFIVSRFREELRQGHDTSEAVVRTVSTAGRTIVFSGATVAVSLAALLVFPLMFLRSFAYAGIAVVALAVLGAVVFLPALLALLGHRVDRFRLFRRRGDRADGGGLWHRVAVTVMQRPLLIAAVVVVLLLDLGVPFLGIEFGLPDDRVLPAEASARQVSQAIRTGFASNEASPLPVVAASAGSPAARAGDIDRYAADLSRLQGVARVD